MFRDGRTIFRKVCSVKLGSRGSSRASAKVRVNALDETLSRLAETEPAPPGKRSGPATVIALHRCDGEGVDNGVGVGPTEVLQAQD